MRKPAMCTARILATVLALTASAVVRSTDASPAQVRTTFDIPAQELSTALYELANKTGLQLVYETELTEGRECHPVSGELSAREALERILRGTGLEFEFLNDRAVALRVARRSASESKKGPAFRLARLETLAAADDQMDAGRVAADQGASTGAEREEGAGIQEVIVTATKRETRLQDTALSISVIGKEEITRRGLTKMDDYMNMVPGVTMQDRGALGNAIVMRGTEVNPADPITGEAVGVYFGETPVSGLGSLAWGAGATDFKMVDIERVEVLRGPQGTLFGAGSMGGTVRILPARPDLRRMEGSLGAEYSRTGGYGGGNSVVQGVFNLPVVAEKLALRAVGYRFDDSGFYKNIAGSYAGPFPGASSANLRPTFGETAAAWGGVARDQGDRGASVITGARLSALWQATEAFSANVSYVWQKTEVDGWGREHTLSLGKFRQLTADPYPGNPLLHSTYLVEGATLGKDGGTGETSIANLTLDYTFPWGGFHSTSSLIRRKTASWEDFTRALPELGVYYAPRKWDADNFTQEVRFASTFKGPFQVLTGAYYEHNKKDNWYAEGFAGDPAQVPNVWASLADNWGFVPEVPTGMPPDFVYEQVYWSDHETANFKQTAIFGEVSYELAPRLTLTAGMRHYEYDTAATDTASGFWEPMPWPTVYSDVASTYQGETYKANLGWKPSRDKLVYFQWAQGFRPGMALPALPAALFDPQGTGYYTAADGSQVARRSQTAPDHLDNYEVGFRGTFADGRIVLDTAVYHIDWRGLPVSVRVIQPLNPGIGATYVLNAGKSTSEGIELGAQIHLSNRLRLDLNGSYNEAKLAEDGRLGEKGDDLPGSADISANAGLEYGFKVLDGRDAYVRAEYSYVGSYKAAIDQASATPLSGGYRLLHLRGGVSLGRVDLDVYVRNLTGEDGYVTVTGDSAFDEAYRLRPRTLGMSLRYAF